MGLFDKSLVLLGAKAPIPPICIPIEAKLAIEKRVKTLRK